MAFFHVLVLIISIHGAVSNSRLKLFDALHLNKTTLPQFPGIRLAHARSPSATAYRFGTKTGDLRIDHQINSRFQEEFHRNDDVTFVFTFKLHKNATDKVGTLIAVSSPTTMRKFFVMTLEIRQREVIGLEGQTKRKRYEASLCLDYDSNGRQVRERIVLGKNSTMRHWVKGMVRLTNRNEISIYMNCRRLIQKKLKHAVSNIPSEAELRLAQSCEPNFWTGAPQVTKRLLATISRAEILFGTLAFQMLSRCDAFKPEVGTIGEQQMAGSLSVAEPGALSCKYNCKKCLYQGSIYSHGKVFYLPQTPCKRCTCKNGVIGCTTVICPKLTCRFGTYDGEGCCPICRETKCAQEGKVFRFGCQRKCSDKDYNSRCERRRMGCYCPRGTVENEQGQCVKTSDCTCSVEENGETKVFKANTVIALDRCRFCTCNHSKMQCLIYC